MNWIDAVFIGFGIIVAGAIFYMGAYWEKFLLPDRTGSRKRTKMLALLASKSDEELEALVEKVEQLKDRKLKP